MTAHVSLSCIDWSIWFCCVRMRINTRVNVVVKETLHLPSNLECITPMASLCAVGLAKVPTTAN